MTPLATGLGALLRVSVNPVTTAAAASATSRARAKTIIGEDERNRMRMGAPPSTGMRGGFEQRARDPAKPPPPGPVGPTGSEQELPHGRRDVRTVGVRGLIHLQALVDVASEE